MSDVLHDEWDRAYEEGREVGRKEATLDCVEPSHDYGTVETCLTCFEARVREDERARAVEIVDDARVRTVFYEHGEAEGRKKGYAAALRDAGEAVRRVAGFDPKPQMINAQEAIAMIENLGLFSDE